MSQETDIEVLSGPCETQIDDSIVKFSFELDDTQRHAINAIERNRDVLLCMPTGSGKTAVAVYALMHMIKKFGRKGVFCSPIKALTNEKYTEFKKSLDTSVGILTGDIKIDTDANLLVMIFEILRNTLYKPKKKIENPYRSLDEDIDIGVVAIDELHFINDEERGKCIEEIIILLDKSVQLVMFTATISNAYEFLSWVSKIRQRPATLVTSYKRFVPLEHYFFVDGRLYPIVDRNGNYSNIEYSNSHKAYERVQKERAKKHQTSIENNYINDTILYLKKHDLLQVAIFTFSRKKCEIFANNISIDLVDFDEKKEIERIYRQTLVDQKLENIPQIMTIQKLIFRGISFHHSGLLPIMKKLIETLFKLGLIKVLICTETIAIGVDNPTRTCVFTELMKFTKTGKRYLTVNEFRQISGRCGRRNRDVLGHVIILPIYEFPSEQLMQKLILGKSQNIDCPFYWDITFFLNIIQSKVTDINHFFEKSSKNKDRQIEMERLISERDMTRLKLQQYIDFLETKKSELKKIELLVKYEDMMNSKDCGFVITLNKKQSNEYRQLNSLLEKDLELKKIYQNLKEKKRIESDLITIDYEIERHLSYIRNSYSTMVDILLEWGYLEGTTKSITHTINLEDITIKGLIASQIHECNPIILTEIIIKGYLDDLEPSEIIALLSIFTEPIRTNDDDEYVLKKFVGTPNIKNRVKLIEDIITKCITTEDKFNVGKNIVINWTISFDYIDLAYHWSEGIGLNEMMIMLEEIGEYTGNFVRNMLKISNIIHDVESICRFLEKIELLPLLEQLDARLLRDIVNIEHL